MLYPKTVKQLKNFTFVIIDDNQNNALKTKATAESFQNMHFLGMADNYDDGLDIVLEHNPNVIFLEIDPQDKDSKLSLAFINELHRYLTVIPKIFITTTNDALCLEAFKYGVFDYFIKPVETKELRKTLFRLEKENGFNNASVITVTQSVVPEIIQDNTSVVSSKPIIPSEPEVAVAEPIESEVEPETIGQVVSEPEPTTTEVETTEPEIPEKSVEDSTEKTENNQVSFIQSDNPKAKPLVICVKSYGDYRYIDATDICFLQADNNSTDIHLNTGEMITAFKTLKHFEGVLTYPFVRIHNSYIVNTDFVSRIHTGNAVCHIKNTTTKLPFSKSYKENIDAIIATIASGNYLEI